MKTYIYFLFSFLFFISCADDIVFPDANNDDSDDSDNPPTTTTGSYSFPLTENNQWKYNDEVSNDDITITFNAPETINDTTFYPLTSSETNSNVIFGNNTKYFYEGDKAGNIEDINGQVARNIYLDETNVSVGHTWSETTTSEEAGIITTFTTTYEIIQIEESREIAGTTFEDVLQVNGEVKGNTAGVEETLATNSSYYAKDIGLVEAITNIINPVTGGSQVAYNIKISEYTIN